MNPDLKKYVDQSKASGKTEDVIRHELLGAGWSEADIYQVLNKQVSTPIPSVNNTQVFSRKRNFKIVAILVVLVFLVASAAYYVYSQRQIATVVNNNDASKTFEVGSEVANNPELPVIDSPNNNVFYIKTQGSGPAARVLGGSKNVPMGSVKVSASYVGGEPVILDSLDLALEGSVNNITNITLWNNGEKIGSGNFLKGSNDIKIKLSHPVVAPLDYISPGVMPEIQIVSIKADLANVGSGQPGTDGDKVLVWIVGGSGVGQNSHKTYIGQQSMGTDMHGVVISSNEEISATPHLSSITPKKGIVGTKIVLSGTGFTQSSVVLLYGYDATIKPSFVSSDGKNLNFTLPLDYQTMNGNNWTIEEQVMVSNKGKVRFDSGLGSNYVHFEIQPKDCDPMVCNN